VGAWTLLVGGDLGRDPAPYLVVGRAVTRLLAPAVTAVLRMDDDLQPELTRQLYRAIARAVVDEQDLVDPVVRDVVQRGLQRPFCVVRGKDGDDPFLVQGHERRGR